jgi:hypothetical protein
MKYFGDFRKNTPKKLMPNRRKLAQSGHPACFQANALVLDVPRRQRTWGGRPLSGRQQVALHKKAYLHEKWFLSRTTQNLPPHFEVLVELWK